MKENTLNGFVQKVCSIPLKQERGAQAGEAGAAWALVAHTDLHAQERRQIRAEAYRSSHTIFLLDHNISVVCSLR